MNNEKIEKLSDKDIVIYALYILGGWQKRVHTEDIALKCYKLSKSKFSWIKYPQYPDLAPARFALESAKKPKYGNLVIGESERKITTKRIGGWMLTSNGVQWIKSNISRIERSLGKKEPLVERLPANRKLKELIRSSAFKKFLYNRDKSEISHSEFAESIVCTVNTRKDVLNDRLEQLYSIASNLGNEEVIKYVNFCRKRFLNILGDKRG